MNKSAVVRARIEPDLKVAAEKILDALGISPSQAILMLYKNIASRHEWPLELKVPNSVTVDTFNDTDNVKNLVKTKDTADMFNKLGI
jgi:DNA-damage-inducible protein J